jgi:hypothetical protein
MVGDFVANTTCASGCYQTHTEAYVRAPMGQGTNLTVTVWVGDRLAMGPFQLFNFDAPVILESMPGTVKKVRVV